MSEGQKMSVGQEVSESLTSTDGLPLPARPYRLDYGKCNYAAVTFSNCPQRIMLGWGEDWNEARRNNARDYFGKMTTPRQMSLCKIKGRYLVSQKPVVRCSICTGEQVAGFKDIHTSKFQNVMLIKNQKDLHCFMEMYALIKWKRITRENVTNGKDEKGSVLKMWMLFAVLSAVFAALTSILAKIGIDGVNSNLATAIRTVVVVVMAWVIVFMTKGQTGLSDISRKSWIFLILSGLATGASWLCYYKALQMGEASKVVPIDKCSIIITLILAFIFLHESFTWKSAAGCLLIGAGTLLMVL